MEIDLCVRAEVRPFLRRQPLESGCPTACPELVEGSRGFRDVGSSPLTSYSLINKFEAKSGRQKAAKTSNFSRIDRKIELSPYSGIFSI